jgi:hypothetical protein
MDRSRGGMRRPRWLRGLVVCQIPCLLLAFVVPQWAGTGAVGLRLSSRTLVATFSLNAVYGLTLPKGLNSDASPKT